MKRLVCIAVLLLPSCGTNRDAQTKTVERMTTTTGPIVADTPVGQIVIQPVRHEMARSEEAVETQQTRVTMPEVGQVVAAAATGGTPWGGIIGAVTTAAAGFFAMRERRKASVAQRHRDQLIDSVEAAREVLPDDVDERFVGVLGAKQDNDLQAYVRERTG
jgi:hypothetical protein